MRLFKFLLFLLLIVVAYFLLWPTPVQPEAWTPDPIPALEGKFAPSLETNKLDHIFQGACPGCEDIAVSPAGTIYGGGKDGTIYQFDGLSAQSGQSLASTGGRPLGLHLDQNDQLWVCDAEVGLLKIGANGAVQTMASGYKGKRFRFTNDLDIGKDGTVYFTNASDKYGVDQYKFDIIEHRPRGSFYAFHPEDQSLELICQDLYFANGVALSPDEDFALVCETSNYAVRKVYLLGQKRGTSEITMQNLPGYPDGISRGTNGIYWLPIISPRKAYLEQVFPYPMAGKMISRLPNFLQPAPDRFNMILGINEQGDIIHSIQMDRPPFAAIASVQEAYGQLFLGSLEDNGIGKIGVPVK